MQFRRTVLPAPLGPMMEKISPFFTSRLTPIRAWTPPKAIWILLTLSWTSLVTAIQNSFRPNRSQIRVDRQDSGERKKAHGDMSFKLDLILSRRSPPGLKPPEF